MMPKVALVTGAAKRIGLAIGEYLAAHGYRIVLHSSEKSRDAAKAAAARFADQGLSVALVVGDLADQTMPDQIIAEAARAFGPLGLLVNNAALFADDGPLAIDLALWERYFAVNLRAPLLLSQHFVRQVPDGGEAAIVNIIDQRVLRPTPQFFTYSLSKSALWAATRSMAQAFAPLQVRVNAVGPGPVLPNMPQGDTGFAAEVAGLPLKHRVVPDEIAAAVLYLAEAPGVTGQLIAVDSGQHLAWETPDVVKTLPA